MIGKQRGAPRPWKEEPPMELWDLYDKDRTPLHRTHPRGTPLPEGAYHVAVIVVVVNSKGQVLLTRRAPEKDACPGWW